jgi:hypothetical protein
MTILTNTYSASSANAAYASSTQSSNGSHPTFSEEMYSDPEMRPYLGSGPINFRSTFLVESGVSDW